MDIKFDKKSSGGQQNAGDGKGRQNALLVLLLIVVGAFAYIYFFTGLIKPAEDKKPAESATAAVDKKPLPPVNGAAKPDAAPAEAKKSADAPAAKPAAAPAPEAPKAQAEQKPDAAVQAAVKKPLPGPVPAAPAKPAAAPAPAKPVPQPAPQPAAKPSVPAEKKVADAKPQPAKEAEKKPADAKAPVKPAATAAAAPATPKKATPKPAKKEAVASDSKGAGKGGWTVLVGNYVLEEALAVDMAKVRKAGLQVAITAGEAKKTHMNRLLLAEYTDREAAQAELAKLRKFTSDAFMIDKAGMHGVYAGSYLLDARAAAEKARLNSAGFKLTLTRVDVSIPTKNLTAGTFADKAAAEAVVKKLKAADVKATLTR